LLRCFSKALLCTISRRVSILLFFWFFVRLFQKASDRGDSQKNGRGGCGVERVERRPPARFLCRWLPGVVQLVVGVLRWGARGAVGGVEVEGPILSGDLAIPVHDIQHATISLGNVETAAAALPTMKRNHFVAVNHRGRKQRKFRLLFSHLGGNG